MTDVLIMIGAPAVIAALAFIIVSVQRDEFGPPPRR
jgi:hypothetical protein